MSNLENRIIEYVQCFDPAVSGCGGQKALWDCALKVIVGFDLTPEQAAGFLLEYWNDRCDPPWSEKEILHTCENAYKKAPAKRGTSLKPGESSQAVKAPAFPLVCADSGSGTGSGLQAAKRKPARRIRLFRTDAGTVYRLFEEWPDSKTPKISEFNRIAPDCYQNKKPTWEKVKLEWLFEYVAPDGSPFMIWYRRDFFPDENGNKDKKFFPFHYVKNADGTGEFIEGDDPGGKVIPFGVVRFPNIENLFFTEGEKAAAVVNQYLAEKRLFDYTATCIPKGAGSWRDDLKEYFRGKNVFVWPDNDQTGKQYAVKVCRSLEGVARSVLTLKDYPPGFGEHDDAVEIIQYFRKMKEN